MGAHSFTLMSRTTAGLDDAYNSEVSQARHEYGNDGYNGTISTTSGCRQVEHAAMTQTGAELYAHANMDKAQKWEDALAVPVAADDCFTYRTVTFTVSVTPGEKLDEWNSRPAVLTKHDVREAALEEAVKRYGNRVHDVEVEATIKDTMTVTTTPGRAVLRYAVSVRGGGFTLFDTKAKAVAYAKAELTRAGNYDQKLDIRMVRAFTDTGTTVAATVEKTTAKATGKVTVTLATLKPGVPRCGWLFFGWAAS
jgi:hypothetical protein